MCSGDTVTLTCNITGATALVWLSGTNLEITTLDRGDGLFGLGEQTQARSGVNFSFSVLATPPDSPQFVSQLRFVPDGSITSVPVTCEERADSGDFSESTTTAVAATSEDYCSFVYNTCINKALDGDQKSCD